MFPRLILLLLLLAAPALAHAAQLLPGAGSPAQEDARRGLVPPESHGWVSSPGTGAYEAVILHLPPRIEPDGEIGAADGFIRLATSLPKAPIALAAWDHRLYMVFPPEEAGPGRLQRAVLSTGAVRGPIGGQWGPESEGRRLPALPALPGEGQFLGVVGTRRGPAALLELAPNGQPDFSLLLLTGPTWRPLPLPADFVERIQQSASPRISLIALAEGLAIALVDSERRGGIWSGTLPSRADEHLQWDWRPLALLAADGSPAPLPDTPLYRSGGQFIYAARAAEGVELWALDFVSSQPTQDSLAWRLAHIPAATSEWALAPLDQVGRIAIVWVQRIPTRASRSRAQQPADSDTVRPQQEIRRHIAEVSIYTGAVLYQGPIRVGGPVSPEELRLLALVLVALVAVILIFVLRPEHKGPPLTLPRGYALAEPGRRIAASAIDLLLATFIAAQITGVSIFDLLTLRGILIEGAGGAGLGGLLVLLITGFVFTTLGEGLTGRSFGKFITGCEVVRPIIQRTAEGEIVPSVHPPGLWRAAVRNLIKWSLPPIALAGLGTLERRHRGDIAAGTAVVIRIEEPETA
jgi:hypothetical protein